MSKVSVCNMSLVLVGGNPITSLDDGQTEAIACNAFFDNTYEEVISARSWSFAKKRKELLPEPQNDVYGRYRRFQVPPDCVRVIYVTEDATLEPNQQHNDLYWQLEDRHILASVPGPLYAMYVSKGVSIQAVSPQFKTALAYRLASDLAMTLLDSSKKSQEMMTKYAFHLDQASTTDGMQGKSVKIRTKGQLTRRR